MEIHKGYGDLRYGYDTPINMIKPNGDQSNKVQQSDWSKMYRVRIVSR